MTDSSWKGNVGLVTTLLEELNPKPGSAALCGPPMMINAVAADLEDRGFQDPDIFISLERHMKCGMGTCEHCTLGPYHVCQEGPIFSYDKVKGIL